MLSHTKPIKRERIFLGLAKGKTGQRAEPREQERELKPQGGTSPRQYWLMRF